MPAASFSAVHGIGFDNDLQPTPNPGVLPGMTFKVLGQTSNLAAGNAANQQTGTVALPALAAGTVGTVVVPNTLVTATTSLVLLTARIGPLGDATAARGVLVWIESVGAGTFTIGYLSPSALMANPWACHYYIVN